MDVKRIMSFRAVAHTGSIGAAARGMNVTQSALSQQLRLLEKEAGTALVLRSPRGVDLTEAGERLLARADAIACEIEFAGQEVGALSTNRAGRIRVISFPSAATNLLPDALVRMRQIHPEVEVFLSEAEPPEAVAAIKAAEAHAAVTFTYAQRAPMTFEGLNWIPLLSDQTYLVTPRGWDDGDSDGDMVEKLAEASWIAGCPHCRKHMMDGCATLGFAPRILHESDDHIVVQGFVAGGLGVALLPGLAMRAFRHPGVDIQLMPAFDPRHVGVVVRPGAERVPAIAAVLSNLAHVAHDLQRSGDPWVSGP